MAEDSGQALRLNAIKFTASELALMCSALREYAWAVRVRGDALGTAVAIDALHDSLFEKVYGTPFVREHPNV